MKTILYARVSTSDQTIQHQQTQAEAAGFRFTDVIIDDGVSGVSTKLREREGGKRLFDMLRAGDVLVVRWVDRLGRDYQDVSDNIRHFMRQGVIVKTVINGMVFDGSTTDPMQLAVRDSLIAFMAALSQAQAEATKEARAAGIKHARETDQKKYRGCEIIGLMRLRPWSYGRGNRHIRGTSGSAAMRSANIACSQIGPTRVTY